MKKWLKISLITSGIVAAGVFGYGVYLYQSVKSTADQMYQPRNPVPEAVASLNPTGKGGHPRQPANLSGKEPFTLLIMGVDERSGDRGRSDTLIVAGVNPANKSVLLFNIPRDTRTLIAGKGTEDKINHAYAFGGVDMAVATVEQFLGTPVDYYVRVNMEGFKQLIDLFGGVQVHNKFAFASGGYQFDQGLIQMDGAKALAYARMRYEDPKGDLGRNDRQKQILEQLMDQALQASSLLRIESALKEVGANVRTDISFDDMKKLLTDYRADLKQLKTEEIRGKGTKMGGIYYYLVDEKERSRIHDLLEKQMEPVSGP
ncbi:LCP family protein [Paenibacillus sp. JX-17]|uniref:LCP family protein n=1 Tax=Paenibacillus lacisoli TaxID=3064525 RepID=A0ABT9CHR1_9BACL|nr:LCP family protein [Paenibacillus sp. JX-17]MDO7907211.1 LCP family protein [Paenibacillus sp. JX-17]